VAERRLWEELRGRKLLGLKFRRQQAIGPFIADFYCEELKLVVEVDGAIHVQSAERDGLRDKWFTDHGFTVVRLTNEQAAEGLQAACKTISRTAATIQKSPSPLGEGLG
jgi:very-short-patch-repair endonuclease